MRNYATAQLIGDRTHQCDATAVRTTPDGTRAYALLDGIGSTDTIRAIYNQYAANPDRHDPWRNLPSACAVIAVTAPGQPLTVAWCGDSRAYSVHGGSVHRLTNDHNLRRVHPPRDGRPGGNRNLITSCLGNTYTDAQLMNEVGHPAIESMTWHADTFRLLLASDGAYEPHEDGGHHLADQLIGMPGEAAKAFVKTAVTRARSVSGPHADNATVLVADIRPAA